ncbi:GMC oxidoreductase [Cecembia calidifontis]|jgi:choline dehydrogenase-like flavoprotein|uniref:Choline dehydrogenase-like flavoprotein n=1 Tax=Cecembia calidifontis TaxID=1187080 RepID=A0A4Q7P6A3_9BACT|nr:GMC family oxidoreductase [Cecembia calidifontis]RZS95495.1 choline dehydrogenase-like flavoprotein [Cecembia calidifontis]
MSNLNIKAVAENTYDAIVVGSGISGGFAAKELCEKGLKTLVLERGRLVTHIQDYPTMNMDPWDFENRGKLTHSEREDFYVQVRSGFVNEDNKHFYHNDRADPYIEEQQFDWIRADVTGGRSLLWGRQCYRWSDLDFEANAKEGIGIDWPIRYKDIAPWYDYAERYVGVSGEKMGLPHLPDGQFLPPMEMNCLEKHVKKEIESKFPFRYMTIGRVANLTVEHNGRGACQSRNRCHRGCPYGAYFSSISVTLPDAAKTGNLTLRPNSVVHSVIYDEKSGRASGVRVVDRESKVMTEYYARIIFLNASAPATAAIMLNSTSNRFPNGLGNDSGELGHNIMDHHYRLGAMGTFDGMEDKYYKGRRPNGIYIPRFRNINEQTKTDAFLRGYGYQGGATRSNWGRGANSKDFGADFKDKMMQAGKWTFRIGGFGEVLPYHENRMYLHPTEKDEWGIPKMVFDAGYKENELTMRKYIMSDAAEMLEAAGLKNVSTFDNGGALGIGVHEMGTARMGRDPKTSVLNAFNQVHTVPNVFVTDGACMTSSGTQNPSITYMALTARAVDHAMKEMNRGNL